ncbi:MAG: MFS transporter [Acetobacteraceae bacterium]
MSRTEGGRALAILQSGTRSRSAKRLVLVALCLGVLIAQIDTSVVNLAVEPIGAAFSAATSELQWMLDAYNLVYTVLLLTGGLFADLYGRRLVFMLGAAVLTGASLASAAAPDMTVLIAARAATGVGAAMLLPASLAVVRVVWQDDVERGRALGIWASCNGLAFAIGPSLGGILINAFGWRSVFLLVVPFGLVALALAVTIVPESAAPARRGFDASGQALGAIALGGLAFAAIDGSGGAALRLAALAASLISLPLFLRVERRAGSAALIPLDLFRNRGFSGALAATATMTFGIYGMIFLLPLLWQALDRLSAAGAGLALLPISLLFFLVSTASGQLAERVGRRALAAGGTALIGLGLVVLATTSAGTPLPLAEAGLLLAGLGMGLNTGPLLAVTIAAVAAPRAGTAAALFNVARMSGAVLGVAVLGALFAAVGGGAPGFQAAMLAGGLVQLTGAAIAAATIPRQRQGEPKALELHEPL